LLHGVNRDLIFQLFYNLVNNAIRYNREEGEILISDKLVHGKSYSLSITDTGIGIGEKDLETIFDRFRKKSGQSGEEGYGLGLSIVKSIVRYHGMNIVVSSEVGSGSEFRLIFPREIVA
jgi:signal transduction histidine kinase